MSLVLELDGVKKAYRGRAVLEGVSLSVNAGEVWGLVGENGAGKSTLLRIVAGLQAADAGRVECCGRAQSPAAWRARASLGYASERPALYPEWTVRANLAFFAKLRALPAGAPAAAPEALGLAPLLGRKVRELSRGQLQRAALGVALLGAPPLLLLDEPHGGLDLGFLAALEAVLAAHARAGGAVLLTSHVLSEVERSCSHVAVLAGGKMVAAGTVAEVTNAAGVGPRSDLERALRKLVAA